MKWDGEKDETIEANYPNRGTYRRPSLGRRVLAYLEIIGFLGLQRKERRI